VEVSVTHPAAGSQRAGEIFRQLYRKCSTDAVADNAAAVGYYFLFSLFPFLLFVVTLCAYLPLAAPVGEFLDRARPIVPAQAMALVEEHLEALISRQRPQLLTLGLLLSFWSASRAVDAVRRVLNLAHGVEESRSRLKTELLSWGLTVAGVLLATVAASALIAGSGLGLRIAGALGIRSAFLSVMPWLRWPTLAAIFAITAGLAYWFLPDVKVHFRYVVPGAAIGAMTWALATWGFGHYATGFGDYDVTYGSLGGVMILLTWLFLSAFIILASGELNAMVGARAQISTGRLSSRRSSEIVQGR
jgi:membrane protein